MPAGTGKNGYVVRRIGHAGGVTKPKPFVEREKQQQTTALKNAAPTGGKLRYNTATGTVTPVTPKSSDPYIKNANKTVRDYYNAYNTQYQNLRNQYNYANQNTNQTYDTLARNIYGAYMQQAKNREQLASNTGMTGGAVERLNVGNETNYNSNYGTSEGLRVKALADNRNSFNTGVADALASYQDKVTDAYRSARDASYEAKEAEKNRKLDVYQSTVGRFDTIKKCANEIKKLKKQKPSHWKDKIKMVKAQAAAVRAAKKGQEVVSAK